MFTQSWVNNAMHERNDLVLCLPRVFFPVCIFFKIIYIYIYPHQKRKYIQKATCYACWSSSMLNVLMHLTRKTFEQCWTARERENVRFSLRTAQNTHIWLWNFISLLLSCLILDCLLAENIQKNIIQSNFCSGARQSS